MTKTPSEAKPGQRLPVPWKSEDAVTFPTA